MTPPSIDKPAPGELWNFGKLGLSFRGLGKQDAFRLLRWGPMAVADLAAEWFETDCCVRRWPRVESSARLPAHGPPGPAPDSCGKRPRMVTQSASAAFVKGGMGALTQALANAAKAAGVEIKTDAEVERVLITKTANAKLVLTNGEEITARAIVSNADPRTTFLNLVDPLDLDPNFLLKIRNYRAVGCVAKVNLALSGLPHFRVVADGGGSTDALLKLSGRIQMGQTSTTSSAPSTPRSMATIRLHPYMDITIPSLTDPSLAPDGCACHVNPCSVCALQFERRRLEFAARRVRRYGNQFLIGVCAES